MIMSIKYMTDAGEKLVFQEPFDAVAAVANFK
jgi:hypothetical protein